MSVFGKLTEILRVAGSFFPGWMERRFDGAWPYALVVGIIFILDWLTSPFITFPILFVVPVALCARYYRVSLAYGMAIVLPLGRLIMAEYVDKLHPLHYTLVNAATRIIVLLLLAHLVARLSRQNALLKQRVDELIRICAWSRTIEYQGEWLTFETYMKRRFKLNTTHVISPAEAEKIINETNDRNWEV